MVFPNDILSIPYEGEIDVGIDFVLGKNPISVPLYRMACERSFLILKDRLTSALALT